MIAYLSLQDKKMASRGRFKTMSKLEAFPAQMSVEYFHCLFGLKPVAAHLVLDAHVVQSSYVQVLG
jgi:hypothetical protein